MKKIVPLGFIALFLVITTTVFAAHTRFKADLSNTSEVPSVSSPLTGKISVDYDSKDNTMDFDLSVKKGVGITDAHLHCGVAGQNGPVVAHLFGNIPGGFDVNGELADFALKDANIVPNNCNPVITNLSQLMQAMKDGRIYVNVHSVANPSGAARGQLIER